MALPQNDRPARDEGRRVVIRRLRCTRGTAVCRLVFEPHENFGPALQSVEQTDAGALFRGNTTLYFWCSRRVHGFTRSIETEFILHAGEEVWCAFGPDEHKIEWTLAGAVEVLRITAAYWKGWIDAIVFRGSRRAQILRSAMLVHLLTFAPTGALIAAPTTSLPERVGGGRNYDYRFTWIRDSSLGLSLLTKLGMMKDAERFFDWLTEREFSSTNPLQVLYSIHGGPAPTVREYPGIAGYRRSRPVRSGNAAVSMVELDSYGYLADCVLTYLRHGGKCCRKHWLLIQHVAEFTANNWKNAGSSIWELKQRRQYLASKVMSVVTLDRAAKIAKAIRQDGTTITKWANTRDEIFADIMSRGWSDRLGAFRQYYGGDMLDAAALLIPLMNLLPVNHPRVTGTINCLVEHLDVNEFLHRFLESAEVYGKKMAIGDEEGAFLMCSFWLAQILAKRGETERAEDILLRAENIAGEPGLFAEAVDTRTNSFLGNAPLVFSQVEYAKAAIALDEAREQANSKAATASS
jgi:GH15 family glucan-1,4-alpha-glucosidase